MNYLIIFESNKRKVETEGNFCTAFPTRLYPSLGGMGELQKKLEFKGKKIIDRRKSLISDCSKFGDKQQIPWIILKLNMCGRIFKEPSRKQMLRELKT
jgi:hypothetical protein